MGEVITFYSYKGGTGRSMALANTAVLLAKQKKRVLMIDWDLEAPGLDMYFRNCHPDIQTAEGAIEFFEMAKENLVRMEYGQENHEALKAVFDQLARHTLNLSLFQWPDISTLHLLKAGKVDDSYQERIHHFDWQALFRDVPSFFTLFAEYLSDKYDYILIDSRTGHTDISSICTALMPEKLVLVFTPNEQSLGGVLKIARNAATYRLSSDDLRPMMFYPLPSRVDLAEEDLKKDWENRYRVEFENLFKEVYGLKNGVNMENYFRHVQIRYSPRMSYGEYVAAMEVPGSPNSMLDNYEKFVTQLISDTNIWDYHYVSSPYELTLIYNEKNQDAAKELLKHLRPLERNSTLRWEESNVSPFGRWDVTMKRKISTKKEHHLVVVLIDEYLQGNGQDWQTLISESLKLETSGSVAVLPVWINSTLQDKTMRLFDKKLIFPNRRTPLQEVENQDVAWQVIVNEIKKLIKSK